MLLQSIRFDPISKDDSLVSGIHQTGFGLGGIGYSYWRSEASLALHRNLPAIRRASLKDISLSEARELIDKFCSVFINPLIAGKFHWQVGIGSLDDHLTTEQRSSLKEEFFSYLAEFTREKWHWVPLNSIAGINYAGKGLIIADIPEAPPISHQEMTAFLKKPLLANAKKYAGLKARNVEQAKEKLGVLLGALFLCMHSGTHYLHTMGKPCSGVLFFERAMTFYSSRAHLPYLSDEIEIGEADIPLLLRVEKLLEGSDSERKLVRSLRWLNASWFSSGAERFSLICQAIDALTPSRLSSMRGKCDWIHEQLSGAVAPEPIELLFKKIRSDVAHGDAPSLIESHSYLEFLSRYGVDPELAAVEIVRKVLVDNFLQCVSIRPSPILSYPKFVEDQKKLFARYGLDFAVPSGFSFAELSA